MVQCIVKCTDDGLVSEERFSHIKIFIAMFFPDVRGRGLAVASQRCTPALILISSCRGVLHFGARWVRCCFF